METIPLSALELGIDPKGYNNLIKNVNRMKLLSLEKRQKILENADKELPKNIFTKVRKLTEDLEHERTAYEIAGIPYHEGPLINQKIFTSAVIDYLLRNRPLDNL